MNGEARESRDRKESGGWRCVELAGWSKQAGGDRGVAQYSGSLCVGIINGPLPASRAIHSNIIVF